MARTSAVAALRDRLAEVEAERDGLAIAIKAIPRHTPDTFDPPFCRACGVDWPCEVEVAHVVAHNIAAAATHQGNPSSVGSGCDGDQGSATADPATAGASTEGAGPKDFPPSPHKWGRSRMGATVDMWWLDQQEDA